MKLFEFEIPIQTKGGTNAREHWATRARRVKKERGATADAFKVHSVLNGIFGGKSMDADGYKVTLTRISAGTMDEDNLGGVLKSIQDEVASQLGFSNDADEALRFERRQEKCRRGYYGVRVKIEAIQSSIYTGLNKEGVTG